jgi:hypothetical protein
VGSAGSVTQLRAGQSFVQVSGVVGRGVETSLLPGPFDRLYEGGKYLLLFANSDSSNDGTQPTLTDGDLARYLVATMSFPGKTLGGTGPGSSRSEWLADLGTPDISLTNFDNAAETRDYYFTRGLLIIFDSTATISSSYSVMRSSKTPNVVIKVRESKIGELRASNTNGSRAEDIARDWGEADQVDDYAFGLAAFRNYTYLGLGLIFITQGILGSSPLVSIIFFDPYYGKTDVSNLAVRSTRAQFDAAMATASCPSSARSVPNFGDWTVYRYADNQCTSRLGVQFDTTGRARGLWLNFPPI